MSACTACSDNRHDLCSASPDNGLFALAGLSVCGCRDITPDLHRELRRTREVLR